MKKQLLSLAGACLMFSAMQAQPWLPQDLGMPTGSLGVTDLNAVDANNVWVIMYDGSGSGANSIDFSHTTDGGVTWMAGTVGTDTGTYQFSNLSAISGTNAWVARFDKINGAGGGLWQTIDGGVNWTQNNVGNIFDANSFPNVVDFKDSLNGWCMGDPNGGYYEIYTTVDGGATWTRTPQANIPAPLSGEYGIVDRYYSDGGMNIWFGTNKGRMYRSTDYGQTWAVSTVASATSVVNSVAFRDANNGLAVYLVGTTNYSMYSTTDGGATWMGVSPTNTWYKQNLVSVPGSNYYVCSSLDAAAAGTAYTLDDGQNWIDIDNGAQRGALDFVDATLGWCGVFSDQTLPSLNGVLVYTGSPLAAKPVESVRLTNLYPNPTTGVLNVNTINKTKQAMTLRIMNAIGVVVFEKVYNDVVINDQLNLNKLGSGIYFVSIGNSVEQSTSKIVVE